MEKIRSTAEIILLGALIVFIFLFTKGCKDREYLESQLKMERNNLVAMKDTVRAEKTKSGKLQFVKSVFMSDLKNLKALNENLFNEVKDQKQKVFYISQITAKIADDVKKISNDSGTHGYDPVTGNDNVTWNFDTSGVDWSRKLSGKTQFKITSSCSGYKVEPKGSFLDKLEYKFSLTTGLKKSEKYPDNIEIFIKSTYPGMVFDSIQGAIVDPEDLKKLLPSPKPKRWCFGPYVGLGYGVTLQKTPMLVPTFNVGFGVQYKLKNF